MFDDQKEPKKGSIFATFDKEIEMTLMGLSQKNKLSTEKILKLKRVMVWVRPHQNK